MPEAWKHFIRAHSALTRQMDADLIASHGITLSDYAVLLRLSQAPDRRMRRVDLAEGVLLTQSGITRLLAGLENAGWVERASLQRRSVRSTCCSAATFSALSFWPTMPRRTRRTHDCRLA